MSTLLDEERLTAVWRQIKGALRYLGVDDSHIVSQPDFIAHNRARVAMILAWNKALQSERGDPIVVSESEVADDSLMIYPERIFDRVRTMAAVHDGAFS